MLSYNDKTGNPLTKIKMIKIKFESDSELEKAFELMTRSPYGFVGDYINGKMSQFKIGPEIFEILKSKGLEFKIIYE